jgi:anti-sigma-K factor RskA
MLGAAELSLYGGYACCDTQPTAASCKASLRWGLLHTWRLNLCAATAAAAAWNTEAEACAQQRHTAPQVSAQYVRAQFSDLCLQTVRHPKQQMNHACRLCKDWARLAVCAIPQGTEGQG